MAVQPLEVKELAEVLAVDFDDADGIPKLKTNWRWEDEEQALLSSCSSLITIVETEDYRVVQFSHFSVKEFLTSARLSTSSVDVSRYYVVLGPAHTILAQACMGVLLDPKLPNNGIEENDVGKRSPLAEYAARYWVTHAQFERGTSILRNAMELLFDLDGPYFAAWLQLYNIDIRPTPESSSLCIFAPRQKSGVTPLYLAALCGFQDLVEHLVVKYPKHVNASGGYYVTPMVAALAGRHFQIANHLHHNGAHMNVRGSDGRSPLHSAASYGDLEMVQVLLDYKIDVSAQDDDNWTPIHDVSSRDHFQDQVPNISISRPDVARLLLERGADPNARMKEGLTPLHVAARDGRVDVARVLLKHGANVGAEDNKGRTPFHAAVDYSEEGDWEGDADYASGKLDVVRALLEHGANACAEDNECGTPLHTAAQYGSVEVVRMLLEQGVDTCAEDNERRTPLHTAAGSGSVEVVRTLLEHGVNACAEDNERRTPLHRAAGYGSVEVVRMLLEHDANACAEDNERRTPLHTAAESGSVEVVRMLLEHGVNPCAEDNEQRTPLHKAVLLYGGVKVVRVLLEHGANVGAEDSKGRTPYQIASAEGESKIMELLSEHGA